MELVLNVESVLPKMLQEQIAIREHSFMPNHRKHNFFRKLFAKINNTQALSEVLGTPEKVQNANSVVYRCKMVSYAFCVYLLIVKLCGFFFLKKRKKDDELISIILSASYL